MRSFLAAAAGTALFTIVNADLCSMGSALIGGNYYCQAVDAVQYTNFAANGSYQRVTNMNSAAGTCSSEPFGYSGSLAPLDHDVSFHVRGPAKLSKFAFYAPGTSHAKREPHHKRHGHHHHLHHHVHERQNKRQVGAWVVATIDGSVVSWQNHWDGAPAAPTPAPAPAPTGAAVNTGGVPAHVGHAEAAAGPAPKPFHPSYHGAWNREAYYEASSGTAQGLTFLNNMGGQGSGVFDYTFGNSLSYAASDASAGAASPQILKDMVLPSNTEVILMSDQPCSAGSGCGYSRPGTVAHKGFGGQGQPKVFLFEFSMPYDGETGFNGDMPAIWLLNAQIPRTLQYGKPECSCWTTGCGEFDLFEVLNSGDSRCKSTLHGGVQGGDSDYFDRPTTLKKAAVVMSDDIATIKWLPNDYDFPKTLTDEDVEKLGNHKTGGLLNGLGTSVFSLTPTS